MNRLLYLDWMEFLTHETAACSDSDRISPQHYHLIGTRCWTVGLGDWVFATTPFESPRGPPEDYMRYARSEGIPEPALSAAAVMRALAPRFLDQMADEILRSGCRVAGFTTSFSQHVPSLALAQSLKNKDPSIRVVFGGANCDGPMGIALIRHFPCVDVVVRGEGEPVVVGVVTDLLDGTPLRRQPGLCYRDNGTLQALDLAPPSPTMEHVPTPDYDEYFDKLASSSFRHNVSEGVRIPVEAARGCWWGQKQHCTFCGLNGSSMMFRSKEPTVFVRELEELARRYRRIDFEAVDNILDFRYFRSVLPELQRVRRAGWDLSLFYETKANLTKTQVRQLRDAGILRIQAGIESLSTPILHLMRKGVTALQNIRLLKWAAQYGVGVTWNIIYGFPNEMPQEYARVAEILPSLTHLRPGSLVKLRVQRFSPYHDRPEAYGLVLLGPATYYRFLYPLKDPDLSEVAYDFEYAYADYREPDEYVRPLKEAFEAWEKAYAAGSTLRYQRGPNFVRVFDRRANLARTTYLFDDVEAAIYLACDAGRKAEGIWCGLNPEARRVVSVAEVRSFLDTLVQARLVYVEEGRYLSLAVPTTPDRDDAPVEASEEAARERETALLDSARC